MTDTRHWQKLALAMSKSYFVASTLALRREKHMFLLKAAQKRKGNLGFAFCIRGLNQSIVRLAALSPKAANCTSVASGYITVATPTPPYRLLGSHASGKFRPHCTEYKILHHLQSNPDQAITQIHLFTERFPCPSCRKAIAEYLRMNSHVTKLNVFYEPSWYWREKYQWRKEYSNALKSFSQLKGRLTFNVLYQR